ncbi:hypothetical protein LT101_11835, partial [Limosilactobacillus caviae]|nr:hypothetical protein [Limosilactobacillus caviae]
TVPMFNGGGVNLLLNTQNFDHNWAWDNIDHSYAKGVLTLSDTNNGNSRMYQGLADNPAGKTFSLSFNAKISADCDSENVSIKAGPYDAPKWITVTGKNSQSYKIEGWKWTGTSINFSLYVIGGKIDISNLKLEYGSVATPYSPNPNDLATQSAFSELSQTLQGLRSTVSGNYGQLQNTISQTNQATRNELINKITGVENKTTSTANSLNSVIGRIGSLEHLTSVQVVNNAINANDYTTTGTYFVQSTSSSNVPATNWFYLEVQKADNGRIAQVWQADSNPTLRFVRTKIGDSWSNWQRSASYSEYSELSRTVSGLQSTVSGNYNTLTNQITQTNQTTRNEITDKVAGLQNQITANANSFNVSLSKIQQTDGINLLKGTRDFTGDWVQRNDWTRDGWVDPNGNYAVKRKGAWSGVFQRKWLETGTYIFSVYYYLEASDSNTVAWVYVSPNDDKTIQVTENSSATLEIRNNGWIKKTYIFTVTKPGTSALRVETNSSTATIHVGSYKLERGSTATPWTPNPQDIYMNPNVATKIYTSAQDLNNLKTEGNYVIKATNNPNSPISNWLVVQVDGTGDRLHQTISADNNPNLSYTRTYNGSWSDWQRTVTGGNIMAQINMSAGTTLIQNDKIYMDASSTIFSGNAFIPSAAITSLNADKITAGTINGAKVNVINLNANNITAGTLRGSNGEFYLDSGALHVWQNNHDAWIDQNGIHDYDNQGNNVWISRGSISAYGNSSGAYLFDGGLYLHKSQSLSDAVLDPDYGSITKSDNIVSFGTSGLDIEGKDGFLLRTHGWNDQTLSYLNGNEIIGAGIAGKSDGFINIAAKKQLFLYAGEPIQNNNLKTIPNLVLDGTYQNGQTVLKGTFSQYFFQGPSSGFSGGITLQDEFVNVGSLNGKNYFSINSDGAITITANGKSILSLNGLFPGVNSDFNVRGNFAVTGSKNAIVPTSRGMAAINAYETAEYYFGDIGETQTNSNGVVTVMIDPYFLETVNTLVPYQVFLTSYGDGNVWVSSRSANNFTVKSSNPNIHFAWEIKAKRKGYENDRMKIVKGVFNNEQY